MSFPFDYPIYILSGWHLLVTMYGIIIEVMPAGGKTYVTKVPKEKTKRRI